jgi:ribosomal protein L17
MTALGSLSPPETSAKIALSWADVILIVLVVAAGVEAWNTGERLASTLLASEVRPDTKTQLAIAARELQIERGQVDVAGLRAALLEEQLDATRHRATLDAIERHYSARDESKNVREKAPSNVLNAYAQAQIDVAVSQAMLKSIQADIAKTEAILTGQNDALRELRRTRDTAATDAQGNAIQQRRIMTGALKLGGTLVVLVLGWLILTRAASTGNIHTSRVMAVGAAAIGIVVAHTEIGAVASLTLGLLVLGFTFARS